MLRVISEENIVLAELDILDGEHTFFINQASNSLDDYFRLFDKEFCLLPKEYLNVCKTIGLADSDRFRIVPTAVIKKSAEKISIDINAICNDSENARYMQHYVQMRSFLDSMRAALVDETALNLLIESQKHVGVQTNLKSFKNPRAVKYSMSNSSTGRLSVVDGPKILTSPSEVKSVLKSRFRNGKLLQIDLSCAEPNFAMFVSGRKTIPDLYSFCAQEVLENRVDRNTAKLILLSAIYGQSNRNLAANVPKGINPAAVSKTVKDFLFVPELQEKLRSKWVKGNCRNYLGRPLMCKEQRVLVSHYLQSSVAEASILMFDHFCSEHDVVPLFVIHDALIVDCNKQIADHLLAIDNFNLIYENEKFPASITQLE